VSLRVSTTGTSGNITEGMRGHQHGGNVSEPSKYDLYVRMLVGTLHADAAIVLVIGGDIGNGCARAEVPKADPEAMALVRKAQAMMLRRLADDIEKGITQPDQARARRGSA
jgi:hypothetical protein